MLLSGQDKDVWLLREREGESSQGYRSISYSCLGKRGKQVNEVTCEVKCILAQNIKK